MHKSLSLILMSVALALAAPQDGVWSPVLPLPISPISGAISPTGELLMWSGNSPGGWLYNMNSPDGNRTYYSVFTTEDFLAKKAIALRETFTVEMFCPGTANLPNGDLLMNGGSGPYAGIIFAPRTRTFSEASVMNIARAYQANVVTTAGRVFTVGGSFTMLYGQKWLGNRDGEVLTPGANGGKGAWTVLNNVKGDYIGGVENGSANPDRQGMYRSDNHAWLFGYQSNTGDEMVFHAGPVAMMHIINVGKNTMVPAGLRGNDVYSMNGNVVQYTPGKIFKTGGATAYGDLNSQVGLATKKESFLIDISQLPAGGKAVVTQTTSMNFPRALGHSIPLPGGKIFIVGGQTNLHLFEDTNGVLQPELFDPVTKTYRILAPMQKARNYHSVALLTRFGTIWVGGGGAYPNNCAVPGQQPCTNNVHFDGEVYTPPYLSQNQVRPAFVSVSGAGALYGSKLFRLNTDLIVQASGCGTGCTYELLRINSATHSVNNDQLRVPLQVKARAATGDTMAVAAADKNFVISGYYYLFAINSDGTPSVATMVQLLR